MSAEAGTSSGIDAELLIMAVARFKWGWLGWTDTAPADEPRRIRAIRNAGQALAEEYDRLAAALRGVPA